MQVRLFRKMDLSASVVRARLKNGSRRRKKAENVFARK
jgi:hypothetical protein